MYDQYDIGETATLRVTCIDSDGELADPILLALVVTHPDASQDTYAVGDLDHDGTGEFSTSVTLDADGVWTYTFAATGNDVNFVTTEYLLVGLDTRASGPCDLWIGPADVFALPPASQIEAAHRDWGLADECAQAASRLLYILSRSRYPGVCRDVVRPCRTCTCGCEHPRSCGCPRLPEIALGASPVLWVTEVRIDGAVLSPSAYRLDGDLLVRVDGSTDGWPVCQDLAASPLTEEATFQVTFFHGRTPPADGILAAKRLAGDLYQGITGGDCAIPPEAVAMVRRGIAIDLADATEITDGLLGLREVDLFLAAERWQAAHRTSLTISPDTMPAVRRVGT